MQESSLPALLNRFDKWLPLALCSCLLAVYSMSLGGGFLVWDDPWLIVENVVLRQGFAEAMSNIWFDWSRSTRLSLGAEYLPIRDTSLWLEAQLWGLEPRPLRLSNWAIYVAGILCIRGALRRTLSSNVVAEVATWVFAFHPVHVESVAWLAGRKDVLALAFVGAGLLCYSGDDGRQRWWVVPLFLLAHLSKSMSVIAVGLLVAQDVLARRRPNWRIMSACLVAALGCLMVHLRVGEVVAMIVDPVGGSRLAAVLTMGPVWLRYMWLMVFPGALSLVHDVAPITSPSLISALGYSILIGWGCAGVWWFRSERRSAGDELDRGALTLSAFLWFVVPLAPVSQVLFPLQNLMADRYLIFSVMAVALVTGWVASLRVRAAPLLGGLIVACFSLVTADRASLFASSVDIFLDATHKTEHSTLAPYQLGQGYEHEAQWALAADAYRIVLERDEGSGGAARRATNNLARLLVMEGELARAEQLLARGIQRWPHDPKMHMNLVKVLYRRGRELEARRLFAETQRRFPDYDPLQPEGIERLIGD